MEPKSFIINGNNFNNLTGFYNEVEMILTHNLDWKIGRNLNALNDVLSGGFNAFEYEENIILIWEYSEKSKIDLGYQETINSIENSLRYHPSNRQYLTEELAKAKENKGQTLFDTIIEIIKGHKHIKLILN